MMMARRDDGDVRIDRSNKARRERSRKWRERKSEADDWKLSWLIEAIADGRVSPPKYGPI